MTTLKEKGSQIQFLKEQAAEYNNEKEMSHVSTKNLTEQLEKAANANFETIERT